MSTTEMNPYMKFVILFLLLNIPGWIMSQGSSNEKYEEYILTPPPPQSPQINGPELFGLRPGSPLIYRIPCTGDRPIQFEIEDLPKGIILDKETGILTGTIEKPGSYSMTLKAKNILGNFPGSLHLRLETNWH